MSVLTRPPIVTNGLVLYLDAANRKSYPGTGTTWFDLSGNNYTGSLVNGPTFNSTNGGSIVFDGVNDYTTTALSTVARPFSMAVWVYFNNLTGWQTFIGQNAAGSTTLGTFYFQKTNDNQSNVGPGRLANTVGLGFVENAGSGLAKYCYDTTAVTTNIWYNYHVSATTTDLTLYKNGVLVFTTGSAVQTINAASNVIIAAGYYANSIVDYSNVRLSTIQIYNRALSAQEVLQNYNAQKARFGLP
jgi:hypothetical protein